MFLTRVFYPLAKAKLPAVSVPNFDAETFNEDQWPRLKTFFMGATLSSRSGHQCQHWRKTAGCKKIFSGFLKQTTLP